VLASLLFARLYLHWAPPALTSAALVLSGSALAGLPLAFALPAALVLLPVFWLGANTVVTTGITYRQISTPESLLSRVNAVGRRIAWGGQAAGPPLSASWPPAPGSGQHSPSPPAPSWQPGSHAPPPPGVSQAPVASRQPTTRQQPAITLPGRWRICVLAHAWRPSWEPR